MSDGVGSPRGGPVRLELDCLGESSRARLQYRGNAELAQPEAWVSALAGSLSEDRVRGMTTVGPHRDDLLLDIGGRRLRDYGSTGQQRSAAIALKLLKITALREARGTEPVLLLDDELPTNLDLPVWEVENGRVRVGNS